MMPPHVVAARRNTRSSSVVEGAGQAGEDHGGAAHGIHQLNFFSCRDTFEQILLHCIYLSSKRHV
jgi:hypothetical protein